MQGRIFKVPRPTRLPVYRRDRGLARRIRDIAPAALDRRQEAEGIARWPDQMKESDGRFGVRRC